MDHTKINHLISQLCQRYSLTHAQTIAWWLLEAATHKSKLTLLTKNHLLTHDEENILKKWVAEHLHKNKPLQYILGTVPFGPLTITVTPPILIPRPETEAWCDRIVKQLSSLKKKSFTVLDMCTGSGCIGLWIAKEFPLAQVYAVDISQKALECAQQNAAKNALTNITFIHSDLFTSLPENLSFDVILSNPPYVTEEEWIHMEPTITQWEDKRAFVAPNEGLELIENIIKNSRSFLKQGSPLLIEIGHLQGKSVIKLFQQYDFKKVTLIQDDAGKDRLAAGVYIL